MPEHITAKLTKRLDLDAEQQVQVLAVFKAYEGRMEETRQQRRALIDALIEEVRLEIAKHLTPEQQAEHKKMLEEMDQRRRENRALIRAYPPKESTNSGK